MKMLNSKIFRHVVDACSFFKTNSFLLGDNDNNIDRRRCYCCCAGTIGSGKRFCGNKWQKLFNQKQSRISRIPSSNCCCCDHEACVKSSIATFNHQRHRLRSNTCLASVNDDWFFSSSYPVGNSSSSHENFTLKRLHQRELALIGLPIYEQKRGIVERVVAGIGEQVRGAPTSVVLLAALESLLVDGLHSSVQPWDVIRRLTGKGANTSYRSLFARFIDCLELLSVLNRCNRRGSLSNAKFKLRRPLVSTLSLGVCEGNTINYTASKLPSDSRVPKSSSLPSRILHSNNNDNKDEKASQINKVEFKTANAPAPDKRRSMIPVLSSRSKSNASSYYLRVYHSRSSSRRSTPMRVCNVRENISEEAPKNITKGTLLNAHKGEHIGVISVRGAYSRCVRLSSELAEGKLILRNGVIPTDKLEFLHTD
uniref:Enhancer of polycomb-like protein n=1 Tax=Meloidogyne hapla TaxID=6305 RepID=A0A1I8B485_MELHA